MSADVPAACAGDVRGETFATGSLEERLAALRRYAAANAGKPATLVLTDAVLTESVRAQLAAPDAPPFRDAAVAIRPDGLHVSGAATAVFLRFPISATLVPEVANGTLRFTVSELQTGSLPGQLRQQIGDLLARAADPSVWRLPLRVDDAVLRTGCGALRGVTTAP